MSDTIRKKTRQQATLFVLGSLSRDEQAKFEATMRTNKSLEDFVNELSATLDYSEVMRKKRPSLEFLQGQRNLLRHRIAEQESGKSPVQVLRNVISSIIEGTGRLLTSRQPAWAIAAYIIIAFFGGIMINRTGTTHESDVIPGSKEDFVMQTIDAGDPVRMSNADDSSVSFVVKDRPQIKLAGDVSNSDIKDMLYYSLLNDQNDGNRMKAINQIRNFEKDVVTMDVLIYSLLNERNPGIRLKAIKALKEFKPNTVLVQACTKVLLGDVNDKIRLEALSILSAWNQTDIVQVLQVVSGMDKNEHIRNESKRLLNKIQFSRENETIKAIQ